MVHRKLIGLGLVALALATWAAVEIAGRNAGSSPLANGLAVAPDAGSTLDTVQEPPGFDRSEQPGGDAKADTPSLPELRHIFDTSQDKGQKQRAASLLLLLGDRDQSYLDYLIQSAQEAIESDMPFPVDPADNEEAQTKSAQAFVDWCSYQGIDPADAYQQALFTLPADVHWLARAGDPRSYDLLLRALQSPNPLIVSHAAEGLGKIGNPGAIPHLRETARRMPSATVQRELARALLYFDDDAARETAAEYLDDASLNDELQTIQELRAAQKSARDLVQRHRP